MKTEVSVSSDTITGKPIICSTGSTMYRYLEEIKIVSAGLIDGRIEIVRRYKSGIDCTPSIPDRIEKEIYIPVITTNVMVRVEKMDIVLYKTIKGGIISGYSVDEQIKFEE